MCRKQNCPVEISGGFWLLCAWFGVVNGWMLTAYVVLAAAIHECGHFVALRLFGAKVTGLRIGVLGAEMTVQTQGLSYGQELLAVLAGPGVNFVCALALQGRNEVFAGVHLALCLFNLLPIGPLDGGRGLSLLAQWWLGPGAGQVLGAWIGRCASVLVGCGLVWVMVVSDGSLWLLPMAVGFFAFFQKNLAIGG